MDHEAIGEYALFPSLIVAIPRIDESPSRRGELKGVNTVFLTDGLSNHQREIEYSYENAAGTTRNAVAGVHANAQAPDAANG